MARYSAASSDHAQIFVRVNPKAANDHGEVRLLFGWQSRLSQSK